ncbi:MAG: thiosulfate oxidation carrier protein SoxY [Gammaproteobacteria bacterium]|nr:thiosulfate oxidation carrier protein SoxY [Gammaproteobacteria bacterium]
MKTNRRTFLKNSAAVSAVGLIVSAGLLSPRTVFAAWPKAAFEATDINTAVKSAFDTDSMTDSGDIKLKAPDIAENGAVVPITVTSNIAGTESISILIAQNPTPLTASFNLAGNTEGFVSTRVKMSKTSEVVAVVKAGGKLYTAKKEVKVTIGGCGG